MFESRERMTRIVEQGDDFIWSVDPLNFGLLSFNERYCDYFEQQRGIKIKLGSLEIDGSLRNRMSEAIEEARKQRGVSA